MITLPDGRPSDLIVIIAHFCVLVRIWLFHLYKLSFIYTYILYMRTIRIVIFFLVCFTHFLKEEVGVRKP